MGWIAELFFFGLSGTLAGNGTAHDVGHRDTNAIRPQRAIKR